MVMGEKITDTKYENTITVPNIDVGGVALGLPLSEIMLVEPKIVVEVEYERLSEGSTPTFGAYYLQETKKASKDRRARKSGYKLYPQLIQSRRMIGPAQMTRVRDDKDPMNTHDIRMEQADGRRPRNKESTEKEPYCGLRLSVLVTKNRQLTPDCTVNRFARR